MTLNPGTKTALLIAAHGERRSGAGNQTTLGIARAIAARGLVAEVGVGFINGSPTVAEAFASLIARNVIVYPLFASNGYFTRDRLVQILDEANGQGRVIQLLQPLGLDPGLPVLVADWAGRLARDNGFALDVFSVILLAHGSRHNPASREATEWVAGEIARLGVATAVRSAFLEEPPLLDEVVRSCPGPAIVVGMFSGDGLHGARDAPLLVAKLGRPDVIYSGVVGGTPGIKELVSSSVINALAGSPCEGV